jgi:glucan phosphorylase
VRRRNATDAKYDANGIPRAVGKELRLKQQYFWTAASLQDILRRFKNIGKKIEELPNCAFIYVPHLHHLTIRKDVAIQLNDVSAPGA